MGWEKVRYNIMCLLSISNMRVTQYSVILLDIKNKSALELRIWRQKTDDLLKQARHKDSTNERQYNATTKLTFWYVQ